MENIVSLIRKKSRTVIGILSGTSVDAVDVVLVKIKGKGKLSNIKVIDFKSYPVSNELKGHILKYSSPKFINTSELCKLNFIIGDLFADSVCKFLKRNKLTSKNIDLIGSHGQTIYHFPENKKQFGYNSKSTLQLGEPSVIAVKTGITVAADFRVADVAAGGDGAPLVPYLDYLLFSDKKKNRAFVNIGGISNVTFLKKNCSQNKIIAFDTGPGNMLIDNLMFRLFKKSYDMNGKVASKGRLNEKLFKFLSKKDKFYIRNFPKSTGRELYGEEFVNDIIKFSKGINKADIIHTITKFTAYTIYYNLKKFEIDELIISGGGAKNPALMNFLIEYFPEIAVKEFNENGITSENKEAVLFAVLANELFNGNKTNIKSVTGAERNVFLGKICPA